MRVYQDRKIRIIVEIQRKIRSFPENLKCSTMSMSNKIFTPFRTPSAVMPMQHYYVGRENNSLAGKLKVANMFVSCAYAKYNLAKTK